MHPPTFGKRIGNRWLFAIEFEASGETPTLWNEWYGSLWFWVDGKVVGNPLETEMVTVGMDSLSEAATETGSRSRTLLPRCGDKEALEIVLAARYGRGEPTSSGAQQDEDFLYPFEILPRRTGPFFDGWEAILVEEESRERFVYRKEGSGLSHAIWPLGTFRDAVREARNEFEKLARSTVGQ
jgi:hypothetical protein